MASLFGVIFWTAGCVPGASAPSDAVPDDEVDAAVVVDTGPAAAPDAENVAGWVRPVLQ